MKLSNWCKKQGISYITGFRWFHAGKIPNAYQMDTGTILVDESKEINQIEDEVPKGTKNQLDQCKSLLKKLETLINKIEGSIKNDPSI